MRGLGKLSFGEKKERVRLVYLLAKEDGAGLE